MKILEVKTLKIPEIKVIRFTRFPDHRGYFTETFRKSDFFSHPQLKFMKKTEFPQCNESFSKAGTLRGLHFQWNPYMGKLVRTLRGRMIDLVLDIRKGSPTFGKAIAYDMPADVNSFYGQWIWVPSGFAHGNYFLDDTQIEYFCSGEYNPDCEAGIYPLASDIDWSLCNKSFKKIIKSLKAEDLLMSKKDKEGLNFTEWIEDGRSDNFIYSNFKTRRKYSKCVESTKI